MRPNDTDAAWPVCLLVTKLTTTGSAKTAEPIEMPAGLWIRVGPGNHTSGGGPNPPREEGNFGGMLSIGKNRRQPMLHTHTHTPV